MSQQTTPGRFITFEGLDGCGKSTQLNRLAEHLRTLGIEVVTTREPGGTEIGERIRSLLLDSRTRGLASLAELGLMFSSRAQLIDELVKPSVAAGKWVICDRYSDSSEAYQGGGRELGSEAVLALHRVLCGGLQPDLTVLMDSDVALSVARARRRNLQSKDPNTADENRFETENRAFFTRVHETFHKIAERDSHRVFVVNARRSIEAVHQDILAEVKRRFKT